MRVLAVVLLLLGGTFVAGETLLRPPVRCYFEYLYDRQAQGPNRYCEWPPERIDELLAGLEFEAPVLRARIAELETHFQDQTMALTETDRVRRSEGMIEEPPALRDARLSLAHALAEAALLRRAQRIQGLPLLPVGGAVAALGAALLLLGAVLRRVGGRRARMSAAFVRAVRERQEERTLEPRKAAAVAGTLFATRRQALQELWAVRPRTCGYCDATLPPEPAGDVVHVTLLKAAPDDVKKTKRVVLAQGWRYEPPEKIACGACGHAVRGA